MSKTILLADDSVTIQKVIELTFMDQDYEVVAVSNGDDALEKLDEIHPDLVIADVHMPGASGFEVARRSKDRRPEVPVLLLVGTFEPFEQSEIAPSGADSHLKKPFDSQELLQLVESLMRAAEAGAGEAGPEPTLEPEVVEGAPRLTAVEDDSTEVTWSNLDLETADSSPFDLSAPPPETSWPPPAAKPEAAASKAETEAEMEPFRLGDELEDEEASFSLEAVDEESFELELGEEPEDLALESLEESEEPSFDSSAQEPGEEETREAPATVGFRPPPPEMESEPEFEFASEPEPQLDAEPEAAAAMPETRTEPAPAAVPAAVDSGGVSLSDEDVERIARRVVDLLGEKVVRDVAWEVVPDLAEVAIKARIAELEGQVE